MSSPTRERKPEKRGILRLGLIIFVVSVTALYALCGVEPTVRYVMDRVGQESEISVVPWARSYDALLHDPGVVVFPTAMTEARRPLLGVNDPVPVRVGPTGDPDANRTRLAHKAVVPRVG